MILPQLWTQTYGINSATFTGSTLWNALTDEIKTCENAVAFKKEIMVWKRETVVVGCVDKVLFFYLFSFYGINILVVVGLN